MQSIYIPELTRQVTQYSKTLEEDVVLKLNLFEYLYFVEIYKSWEFYSHWKSSGQTHIAYFIISLYKSSMSILADRV